MDTLAGASIPEIATASDSTVMPGATPDRVRNPKASGEVSDSELQPWSTSTATNNDADGRAVDCFDFDTGLSWMMGRSCAGSRPGGILGSAPAAGQRRLDETTFSPGETPPFTGGIRRV